jgi:hypothetical protein
LGDSPNNDVTSQRVSRQSPSGRSHSIIFICLLLSLLLAKSGTAQSQTTQPIQPVADSASSLPEAPLPRNKPENHRQVPCAAFPGSHAAGLTLVSAAADLGIKTTGVEIVQSDALPRSEIPSPFEGQTQSPPCPHSIIDPFARFVSEPGAAPLTRKHKAALALNNVIDPFNAVTILATAAISVGADAHSPYGPGMKGFAKNVGVAYTQDISGQFFDTFLIPSLVHQDPRYFRKPHAPIPRRVLNAIAQDYWSRSDSGKGMPNYSTFLGFAINAEIMNLYVPGIQTDLNSTAQRYVIGLASAPIDSFITEFLPDVASKIHVRIVLVQRIINQVARTEPVGTP